MILFADPVSYTHLGHHLDCNGPVALEEDTLLTALAFRVDPELGEMDTPNGHMVFLQAAAITRDELDAMVCWNVDKALKEMEKMCIRDRSYMRRQWSFVGGIAETFREME